MGKKKMFISFAAIGIVNTLIDIVLYLTLSQHGLPVIAANILSTSIALIVSYTLNKRFTFKPDDTSNKSFVPFVLVTLTGLWLLQPIIIYTVTAFMNVTPVHAFVTSLHLYRNYETVQSLAGKLAATPASLVWNFTLYKKFVFKPVKATSSEA